VSHGVGEFQAIALIERVLGATRPSDVEVSIGDDAAVLALPRGERLIATVDACVDGVHFDRRWLALDDVGWRAFSAAASDLAAMAAHPVAALSSLVLPRSTSSADLRRLARGQAAAARALGCPIVGGNIARGGELSITTVVLGRAKRPLLRSGARAGDELWLVGDVGRARAGLVVLQRALRPSAAAQRCVSAWRRPRALIDEGLALAGRAHAAIDVSDGLAGDAAHLAKSSGVRVVIDALLLERTLSPALRAACRLLALDPLDVALQGGEDYALLAAGPARRRPRFARVIGRVEESSGAMLQRADGGLTRLRGGFDHFRR
jgi:thiamine-monophosphate kinase